MFYLPIDKYLMRYYELTDLTKYLDDNFQNIEIALSKIGQHVCFYRGIPTRRENFIYDSSAFERKSANSKNYYTLTIDNSPEWSQFPKRSRSAICTTSDSTAGKYGSAGDGDKYFIVLPFGNPVIGICPSNDIWHAFGTQLNWIADCLHGIAIHFQINLSETDYNLFCKQMDEIGIRLQGYKPFNTPFAQDFDEPYDPFLHRMFQDYKGIFNMFVKWAHSGEFLQHWKNYFSPNTFIAKKLSTITLEDLTSSGGPWSKSKECWFSGPAMYIKNDDIQELWEYIGAKKKSNEIR